MTVQQEAIRMVNSMTDDTFGILVEFLKRMMRDDSHFDVPRVVGDVRTQLPRESWE